MSQPAGLRVRLAPLAEMDVLDIVEWYSVRSEDLGERFVRAVDEGLVRLSEYPASAPIVYRKVRRLQMGEFPYGIFYVYERKRVRVIAVMHSRRDPRDWQVRTR